MICLNIYFSFFHYLVKVKLFNELMDNKYDNFLKNNINLNFFPFFVNVTVLFRLLETNQILEYLF